MNDSTSGLPPMFTILSLLDGVRKSGKGYICKCPSHNDRNASLSITEADNGNCLIYCFAGCSALSVLQALGLEMADLYPPRITEKMTPQQRAQARAGAQQAGWRAALDVLAFEAEILIIGGSKSVAGSVTFDDLERMVLAVKRIQDVKGVLNGR